MNNQQAYELVDGLRSLADFIERTADSIEGVNYHAEEEFPLPLSAYSFSPNAYVSVARYVNQGWDIENPYDTDPDATQADMVRIASLLGSCSKEYHGNYFSLVKNFGPIKVSFQTPRDAVCTKRVVGTETKTRSVLPAGVEYVQESYEAEVVEWDCHPLLAPRTDDTANADV